MNKSKLTNKKRPPDRKPLSVTSLLAGTYRAVLILTLLKARLQYLLSPVDLAVSIGVAVPSKMISKNISLLLFKRRSKRISKHRLVTRKGLLHSNQDGEMFDDKYQANNIPAKRLKEAVHIGVPKPLIDSYCLNKLKEVNKI